MSDTCIVCLGDLGESANDPPRSIAPASKLEDDAQKGSPTTSKAIEQVTKAEDAMIAHLLPCGHDLHNECLKPWVERANSCPICRQSFNQVELSDQVGRPVISSYAVSDRTQIAEIDPSMLIEDFDDDELESQPCPICGNDDNEDDFLGCDGCGTEYHIYCVDLTSIPHGHWFCEQCIIERASEGVFPNAPARRPYNATDSRTRSQRRVRSRNQASSLNWARVWQSVWDRLNLDLDDPFDEGFSSDRASREQRERSQRRDFRQWQRRFQVAERQGAANRFRDAASTLLDIRVPRERPEPPEPESQEEIRAWNALEKAKQIQVDPSPSRRKRRSATGSPSDPEPRPQPERPLKRPRTRRNEHLPGSSSDVPAESSTSRRSSAAGPSSSHTPVAVRAKGPSFLQSLLKEVETSAAPDETKGQTRPTLPPAAGNSPSRNSSPGASPTASNHASPRALSTTPPPHTATRPLSPFSLTSKVEPIFPPPEFSPNKATPGSSASHRDAHEPRHPPNEVRHSRPRVQQSPGSSPPRSVDNSPSRINLSLSAKSELQSMVTAALRPHYKSNALNNDQYTDINRNISRMLYDKVGENGNVNGEARESWERLANDEVAKALQALKSGTWFYEGE